jgi:MFS family permease
MVSTQKEVSFFKIVSNRQLYLYFIAWLMFSLVNGFGGIFLNHIDENLIKVEPIAAAFSAVIAGFVSDWVGRRRVLIFGFVSLGLAYATIGIFTPGFILTTLFLIVDGIAIGSLWVLFTLVIWGEVARNGIEKHYAIGEAPFFLTQIVAVLTNTYLVGSPVMTTSIFSLAAFFLFIAVIPLLYARETLPQRKIEERQLKIYTEEALKIKRKVEQRN